MVNPSVGIRHTSHKNFDAILIQNGEASWGKK